MAQPDPGDVPIKPAATVMLVRDVDGVAGVSSDGGDGGDGVAGVSSASVEVFMLRRTSNAVFGAGMYVFPGGKLDPADGEGDEAYVVAAIRECYEEAGVLLVEDERGELISDGHPALDHREAVYHGTVDVRAMCAEHGLQLATDRLAWVAHWITPKGETARRFDTRFFLAVAPPGQSSVHDDNETVASEWIRPSVALERQRRQEMSLMPPTIATLEFLARFGTAEEALAGGREIGTPPVILPKIRRSAEGGIAGVALPDDDDYEELDGD